MEFNKLTRFQRKTSYRVGSMLLQPGQDICNIEYRSVCGADGVGEGLERDGAEIEWETFEGGTARAFGLVDSGPSAGGVCIFRGPLRVRNLQPVSSVEDVKDRVLTYSLSVPALG